MELQRNPSQALILCSACRAAPIPFRLSPYRPTLQKVGSRRMRPALPGLSSCPGRARRSGRGDSPPSICPSDNHGKGKKGATKSLESKEPSCRIRMTQDQHKRTGFSSSLSDCNSRHRNAVSESEEMEKGWIPPSMKSLRFNQETMAPVSLSTRIRIPNRLSTNQDRRTSSIWTECPPFHYPFGGGVELIPEEGFRSASEFANTDSLRRSDGNHRSQNWIREP